MDDRLHVCSRKSLLLHVHPVALVLACCMHIMPSGCADLHHVPCSAAKPVLSTQHAAHFTQILEWSTVSDSAFHGSAQVSSGLTAWTAHLLLLKLVLWLLGVPSAVPLLEAACYTGYPLVLVCINTVIVALLGKMPGFDMSVMALLLLLPGLYKQICRHNCLAENRCAKLQY